MISSSTQAFHSEASQGDQLVLLSPAKRKNAKTLGSVFSSLVEKAKADKDGIPKANGPTAQSEKGMLSSSSASAEKTKKALDAAAQKLDAGKGRGLDSETAKAQVRKDASDARGALSAQTPPSAASAAAPKSARFKETTLDEDQSGASETKQASKHRNLDLLKKERLRDNSDSGADPLSASAVSASAGLAVSSKNVKKEDGALKSEEKAEGIDSKKKDKRKDRLEIEVYDQRKGEAFGASANTALKAGPEASPGDGLSKNGGDMVLSLREGAADAGSDKSDASRSASGSKTSFADALSRELRETYNNDIVKRASVVLKDGGEGLIRLALQPESLGSVKIKLELADNKIAGRILVETDEALKAFGKELRSLEQAFVDGGFDGASIELALSSGDTGSGSGRREDATAPRPFFSDRLIASEYDAAVPAAENGARRSFGGRDDALVDMLA